MIPAATVTALMEKRRMTRLKEMETVWILEEGYMTLV